MLSAATQPTHQCQPTTVLVADDDPISRQLMKRFLESQGHQVILATDGEQAWSLFLTHHPRLVITDWRMPKLDGLELCQRIRAHQHEAYTFVLILTSTTDRDAKVHGFAAGADEFMTKPFDRAELTWRIHSSMRVLSLHTNLQSRINDLKEARSRLELANQEMQEGLHAASTIQRSMLPAETPDVRNVDAAWIYEPSDHLGGDSMNLFRLDEHRMGFFIADVCGHGLPSALLAVTVNRLMSPRLGAALLSHEENLDPLEIYGDPGRVLTTVNQRLPMRIERGEYFTAVYGVIDSANGELLIAGAGHPHPVLFSAGSPDAKIITDGFPIGFDDTTTYQTQSFRLKAGDRLCIYSDGIAEAARPDGEMFGRDRLADQIRRSAISPLPKR